MRPSRVMLLAVQLAALSILTACATQSEPQPVEQPTPQACDPRVTAEVPKPPVKPVGATIVQPVTPDEQTATEAFLSWVSAQVDYGQVMFGRAVAAKADCENR